MATAMRGFKPSLFRMDDGNEVDTEGMDATQLATLGQQAYDKYRQSQMNTFLTNQMSGKANASMAPPAGASPAGGMWDGYNGFMRGRMLAAESQGKNFKVDQRGGSMPISSYGARPSIQALGPPRNPQPADDGWEPPEVRTAKLRILQAQGDRMAGDNIETDRQRDPMMRRFDQQQDNEAAVTRDTQATAPIFNATRERERTADVRDIGAKAYEERTNPYIREARDEVRGDLTTRASMDAFGRAMAGMRPETVEQVENNPAIVDTIRNRMMGRVPAAPPSVDEEPPMADAGGAAAGDYGPIASAAEMPPVMRTELEQELRDLGYVVDEKNLLAVYNYKRTLPQ